MVEGLGRQSVVEKLYAHLDNPPVSDYRLEILLRQRRGRADGHSAAGAAEYPAEDFILKNEVAVHKNDLIVQIFPGQVDGINIVRLRIPLVFYKAEPHPCAQSLAVFHQGLVKSAGCDNRFRDTGIRQLAQLAGEDGFPGGNIRHTFGMVCRQGSHAAAYAGG